MTISGTLALVGSDRFLSRETCAVPAAMARWLGTAWDVYASQFDGFTGARLDPQFSRLDLPDLDEVLPVLHGGTVAIVGTGPSLGRSASALRDLRPHLSIWTSIRGAEALATHGVTPDLGIIQHPSDLDAYLTTRHLGDRNGSHPLSGVPAVLLERRTPAALLAGLDPARLGLVDGAIGWGLWPATLAALAIASGATTVALVGIDLGTPDRVDPAQEPLAELLSLVADRAPAGVSVADAGCGAPKRGWHSAPLHIVASAGPTGTVDVRRTRRDAAEARRETLVAQIQALAPLVAEAEDAHALALAARTRGDHTSCRAALADHWHTLLEHGEDGGTRLALQEGLGARLLPSLWRHAPVDPPGPLWRPVLLVSDEIVRLADTARLLVETSQSKGAAA